MRILTPNIRQVCPDGLKACCEARSGKTGRGTGPWGVRHWQPPRRHKARVARAPARQLTGQWPCWRRWALPRRPPDQRVTG